MRINVVVPQVGEAVSEVTLTHWHKKVGEKVEKGEVLFEVDIDKSVVEVEAFESGTLVEVLKPEGSSVMPRDVVGVLEVVTT